MKNNRSEILERISDKQAEARLKEMGKVFCPEAHTVAQNSSQHSKAYKIGGPFERVFIDGVPYFGERESIEKFLQLKENTIKIQNEKESSIETPFM